MKKILLIPFFCIALFCKAQNHPSCDSLVIACCSFDSLGPNTITLLADNHSSELFDYPGFVLFDNNMDTIAKETVMYFGIGTGFQPHTLDIVAPLNLPFTGKLNLYVLFYAEQTCSFPIYIPDTATGISGAEKRYPLKIFPNPASGKIKIDLGDASQNSLSLSVYDNLGRVVRNLPSCTFPTEISLGDLPGGIYLMRVFDEDGKKIAEEKLIVN